MSTSKVKIAVSGLEIEVNRKDIKNLHLSVCPPDGKVKLSAPLRVNDDNARLAIIRKLSWIRLCQREFREQARESERQFIDGESHYFDGKRFMLQVKHADQRATVDIIGNGRLRLTCRAGASKEYKAQQFNAFYRSHLKKLLAEVLDRWAKAVNAEPTDVRIQRMKTRWGSCNPDTGRILLNLELAKKPRACFEYILVHELAHLRERKHNERFASIVNDVLPDWRMRRDLLNSLPLAYETWDY